MIEDVFGDQPGSTCINEGSETRCVCDMCRLSIALLLSPMILFIELSADASDSVSNVLGRTVCVDVLCEDFESKNWLLSNYRDNNDEGSHAFWHAGPDGGPELLRQVPTPDGGKKRSLWSLEIRTNLPDQNDPNSTEEELLTPAFSKVRGDSLMRSEKPVFIVRVWLPPFKEWGEYYKFGFRQVANATNKAYNPSIFLCYSSSCSDKCGNGGANFIVRIGSGDARDVRIGPITQPDWWTLAIAFDVHGVGQTAANGLILEAQLARCHRDCPSKVGRCHVTK